MSTQGNVRGTRTAILVAALLAAPAVALAAQTPVASPADTVRAAHLLGRATFGIRTADLAAVLREGTDAWLDRQLHPERIADGAVAERLRQFETLAASPGEALRAVETARQVQRMTADSGARVRSRLRPPKDANPRQILGELVTAKLVRAVHSERQLEEVMTDFWYNHFNVFFGKGIDRYLIADYEATAIRPHVFGRFEDMLRATARHPAMLFYLDNWTSSAPDSAAGRRPLTPQQRQRLLRTGRVTPEQLERMQAGQRPGRERGINENYARELLELHTLGVDGGYTQDDVIAVARAFTGWTFRRPNARNDDADVAFMFRPEMHDRGVKVVLGHTLAAGRGIEDGDDVIRMLAAHPTTARFLATKLVERFVTDAPAPALVDEIAGVYLQTGGDLREVTRALFTSARFHDAEHVRAKVKTPFELVASALRAVHADVGMSRRTAETLRALGQLPYNEPAPTGFPAMSDDWVNSGALLARMNFGLNLAGGRIDGMRVDAGSMLPADQRDSGGLADLLAAVMPATPTAELEQRIAAELASQEDAAPRARAAHALGLALGSPEFQRR